MKILITGATGFIGKALTQKLLAEQHTVYALVRSSTDVRFLKTENIPYYTFDTDIENLVAFLQKENFDGVIHLASLFLKTHKTNDVKNLIDSNILFGSLLLEAISQTNIHWFINTGTFWQHYKNKIYAPVNLYSATKEAFKNLAEFYVETSRINFLTIELNDTFGPNDTRPKIFNIWKKIAETGEALDMSPGEQIIDISYIDNVVDAFYHMTILLQNDTKKKYSGKTVALYSKEKMSLKKLAKLFEKTTGLTLHINWSARPYMPREVMIPWKRGAPIPKWKPKVSIAEGIKKVFGQN